MGVYDWHDPWALLPPVPREQLTQDEARFQKVKSLVERFGASRVLWAFSDQGYEKLNHVPETERDDFLCAVAKDLGDLR